MKKNIILMACVFTVGITAAVASFIAPENVYVKARLIEDGPIRCVNTGVQCDETGNVLCTLQVTDNTGPKIVNCFGPYYPYKSGCQVRLCTDKTEVTHPSSVTIWELLP
jgi:hypothetical protein